MKIVKKYLIYMIVTDNAQTYNYTKVCSTEAENMQDAIRIVKETNQDLEGKVWGITSICELDNSITDFDFLTSIYKGE